MGHPEQITQATFESLVIDHHVRLRAFVRSLGVDPDWVDDLAQEAFLIAFREWETFDQSRDFGKWLRGIAANLVRNEVRKDARRRRILHTELTDLLLARQAESQRQPDRPLALDSVRHCLSELAPTSRRLILGRYRDNQTATQLGTLLDTTAANVRQMLVRVRRQIRRCIELRLRQGTLS